MQYIHTIFNFFYDLPSSFLGENDNKFFVANAIKLLKYIPHSKEIKIADAGHACYLNQPDEWHEFLKEALSQL